MAEYCFGRNFTAHRFCSVCGVHVDMKLYGPPEEVVDSVPEAKQKLVRRNLAIEPVRVAVLDDIEWTDINIRRSDEGTGGYVFDS